MTHLEQPRGTLGLRGPLALGLRALWAIAVATALTTACRAADSKVANLTAQQLVDRAAAGATVVLPASATGRLTIANRKLARPLTIDLSRSRIAMIGIRASSNVRIVNGTVTGSAAVSPYGILIQDSQKIEVSNVTVTGAAHGIQLSRSQDVLIANNGLTGLVADGVMVVASQRVKIYNNSCSNFNPRPKIWDAQGNLVKDGDHADCIQGWSQKDYPLTADLEIVGNRGIGNFQGIFLNDPYGAGGYQRVTITDNVMQIAMYHGIHITEPRGLRMTRNRVSTIPGSRDIRGTAFDRPVKAFITIVRGSNIQACGNTIADYPKGEGTGRC